MVITAIQGKVLRTLLDNGTAKTSNHTSGGKIHSVPTMKLARMGLVEHIGKGVYRLTPDGEVAAKFTAELSQMNLRKR